MAKVYRVIFDLLSRANGNIDTVAEALARIGIGSYAECYEMILSTIEENNRRKK